MAEIILLDDLTDADKRDELESLREKLVNYGADIGAIPESISSFAESFIDVMKHMNVLWDKKVSDVDASSVLKQASIFIGLFIECKTEADIAICDSVLKQFTDLLVEGEAAGRGRFVTRILYDMFEMGYHIKSKAKYLIYTSWLKSVSKKNSTYLLPLEKQKVYKYVDVWNGQWGLSDEEHRVLLRNYQQALQRLERFDAAADAMEDLLCGHEDQGSEEALADARTCVLQAIKTKDQFRFDHLRELPVIGCLEGRPEYRLLQIFISGDLDDFERFLTEHSAESLGISDIDLENLREKIKLLTFVELASKAPDVEYSAVSEKLGLNEEEVEELVVRAFQLKLVRGRLDQGNQRVATTYTIAREFSREQWAELKSKLDNWQKNLEEVRHNIGEVEKLADSNLIAT